MLFRSPKGTGRSGGTPPACIPLARACVKQGPEWISRKEAPMSTMLDQKGAYKRALFSDSMPSFDVHPFPVTGRLLPTQEQIEEGFFTGFLDADWSVPYSYLPCAPYKDEYGTVKWLYGDCVRLQINGQLACLLAGMGGKLLKIHSCLRYPDYKEPLGGNRHLQFVGKICDRLPKLA